MNNNERLSKPVIEQPFVIDVPEDTNIIFGDVSRFLRPGVTDDDIALSVQILAGTAMRRDVLYFDTRLLREPTDRMLERMLSLMPRNTVLVYPGNGAQAVKEEARSSAVLGYPAYPIPARRIMNNGSVVRVESSLTPSLEQALQSGQINGAVIVDDVSVTGTTLATVRKQIAAASPQPLTFAGLVWFSYGSNALPGYDLSASVCRYTCQNGKKPPFNSLSTWLRGDEQSTLVLGPYIAKYGSYPYGFTKQLEQIRRLTTL